jgi:hypothetical protein
LSGPQLAECGDGTLLVDIDHIHDEVVCANDPDRQVQVCRREVSYVLKALSEASSFTGLTVAQRAIRL